jgi:hypothetical protein
MGGLRNLGEGVVAMFVKIVVTSAFGTGMPSGVCAGEDRRPFPVVN